MITLTIDGLKVTTHKGASVLDASRTAGIWIPTLCHHDALTPYGGCRLCVVELIEGSTSRIVSSCCLEAAEGMEVRTNTKRLRSVRAGIVELLLAESPDSPALVTLAKELGVKPVARFAVRNERCIACGLCIRACSEIVGVSAINFAGRGYEQTAATPFFSRSEACIGCGTCAVICPTEAITLHDISAGERAQVPEGPVMEGPARIIENWKTGFDMKCCTACGEPFAPAFQLKHFTAAASLDDTFFDVCPNCRS